MSMLKVFFFALLLISGSAQAQIGSLALHSCTDHESWNLSTGLLKTLGPERVSLFRDSVAGKISAARGFSEAIAMRRNSAPGTEARAFSEYWLARVLLGSQLTHAAYGGFAVISSYRSLEQGPSHERGVQIAAMECLNRIHEKYPTLSGGLALVEPTSQHLMEWLEGAARGEDRQTVYEFMGNRFRAQLREHRTDQELARSIAVLKGSGPEEYLARGLFAAKTGKEAEVVVELKKFLASLVAFEPGSSRLQKYQDEARLLLVRAFYAKKDFSSALGVARQIRTSSNELSEALSELSWSALMAGQYPEAIGAALSLESGGLRRTYAPEGSMVMAIAMNELCQFPQSLRAIGLFRLDYERPFRFLAQLDRWLGTRDFYASVVDYLRKKKSNSGVPERVLSEWTRSPVFISDQGELNSLVDEKLALAKMSRLGSIETKKLSADIVASNRPSRENVLLYRKYRYAGAAWRAVLAAQERNALVLKKNLVSEISRDLAARSVRMFSQLQEIVDNNQLIEVEIYSGASQDMIWQNAHPDFKELVSKMEIDRKKVEGSKTWNWGTTSVFPKKGTDGLDGPEIWPEIWEDELASFKADLRDNCTSKDRYVALKQKRSG